MEGFSNSVKKVVLEAEKGVLRGVHGPLSKLISVDKKYSVAIETALGNALQNIVVDEVQSEDAGLDANLLVDFTIILGKDFDGRYVRD